MKNPYDHIVEQFYTSVFCFIYDKGDVDSLKKFKLADCLGFWDDTMRANLKALSEHPGLFSKDKDNYYAWIVFLNAYHAIMRYYKYRAHYNLRDEELELALNEWYKATNPQYGRIDYCLWRVNANRLKAKGQMR